MIPPVNGTWPFTTCPASAGVPKDEYVAGQHQFSVRPNPGEKRLIPLPRRGAERVGGLVIDPRQNHIFRRNVVERGIRRSQPIW